MLVLVIWDKQRCKNLYWVAVRKKSCRTKLRFCVRENDTLQAILFTAWLTEWERFIVDVPSCSFFTHGNLQIPIKLTYFKRDSGSKRFFASVLMQKFFKLFWKMFMEANFFKDKNVLGGRRTSQNFGFIVCFISITVQSWLMVLWNSNAWISSQALAKSGP